MDESRRNSTEHLAVGGGLLAAGVGVRTFVSRDESKRKMEKLIPAAMKHQLTRRHVAHAAGRWGGRAATTVGLPLAAYGTYTSLRPKAMPARKLSYRSDVVSPLTGSLTYRSDAEKVHVGNIKRKVKEKAQEVHDKPFGKRDLTRAETSTLVQRKERGRKISTAAGVMGLTALALRAPEAAKFAAAKSPAVARRVGRLARREPGATRASNALGIVSIGTGSAGSLNYAAQQKLEAQQVKKRDDRFLREHRDRISPEAEKGYRYLRRGRNDAAGASALFGGLAAANVGSALYSRRAYGSGKLGTGMALANGIAAGYTGITAIDQGEKAYRWNSKMGKISAKGRERAAGGVYGRGRVPMSPEVEKALLAPRIRMASPLMRKPALKASYVGTSVAGRKFTVRGSVR